MKLRSCEIAFRAVQCTPIRLLIFTSVFLYVLMGLPVFTLIFDTFLGYRESFKLPDGDLVQCVPIQHLIQISPAAKPTWRMTPSMKPRDKTFGNFSETHSIKKATQLIAVEKRFCPIGAVPMRASPAINYLARILLGRRVYPRMNPVVHLLLVDHRGQKSAPVDSALWSNENGTHHYAVIDVVGPYRGTQGRLSIWEPSVQDEEFSLAQVWVSSIDTDGKLHSLEAGWQIYRGFYSDSKPRLFVYWTADGYITTGCYNLLCPGFIQVSSKWLLGGSFAEVSTFEGDFQYEIKIRIFKDRETGDWWLQLNDDNVGYWPRSLFGPGAFNDWDTRIHWGGEICRRPGHYTDTQMGNGNHPSSSESRRVAYVRNLQVMNCQDNLFDIPRSDFISLATHHKCCDIEVHESWNNGPDLSSWGTFAFFGGPGFNANCVGEKPFQYRE